MRRIPVALLFMVTTFIATPNHAQGICADRELLKAVAIIDEACKGGQPCNFYTLKELDDRVDRASLLKALRSPYLYPVHIFFPEGRYEFSDILDWNTIKRAQLETLTTIANPKESAVYVIGRASYTGNVALNRELSRRRMETVMRYLKEQLRVECAYFKGGWLGKEILQLTDSDARVLNLSPDDFRNDDKILNQVVHVFVYPCARNIPD